MEKNKRKNLIIIVSAIAFLIAVVTAISLWFYFAKPNAEGLNETVATTADPNEFDIAFDEEKDGVVETVKNNENKKSNIVIKEPTKGTQINIVVDDWLKIESLAQIDSRLCVIVENISDKDIEYAELSVDTKKGNLNFRITALFAGQRAYLVCSEGVNYDKNEYYVNWDVDNKIDFEKKPDLYSNKFEITAKTGSIIIKNKSIFPYSGPIYICYKRFEGDLVNGSETRRLKVDSLKSREKVTISTPNFKTNKHKIIFVDYDN